MRDFEWHKKLDDAGSAHRHAMPRISSKIVLEVQAAAVACSALLPLAAEAWGVFWIRTTQQIKEIKQVQKVSTRVKVTQEMW